VRADGLRLALTTLSVAPVRPGALAPPAPSTAMALAPLVGLGLGIVTTAVLDTTRWATHYQAPLLASVLAITALAVLTRGMHLDGLADLADGLGYHGDAAGALEVMRDPHVGAFGALALGLVVLVDVSALSACVTTGRGSVSLISAVMTGRLAVTWSCRRGIPAARSDGLGAMVAGTVGTAVLTGVTAAVLILAAAGAALDGRAGAPGAVRTALGVAAGLVLAELLRRHAVQRLGGITGDVLGALVEVATAAVLVVCAL